MKKILISGFKPRALNMEEQKNFTNDFIINKLSNLDITFDNIESINLNLSIFAIKIPCIEISKIIKYFSKYSFKYNKIKSIINYNKSKKIFLFDLLYTSLSNLPQEVNTIINENKYDILNYNLKLTYSDFSYETLLSAIIPKEISIPFSFETIGHIAHLNLKEELNPYKNMIGKILCDKNDTIKTVLNKTSNISNVFRTFEYEILFGIENTETIMKENGFSYMLDFSNCYWNSRLATEHNRIISKYIKMNHIIFDMFCGVGPFAIPAVSKEAIVYANDLNPNCIKYLKENIKKNKVNEKLIFVFNNDAIEFIENNSNIILNNISNFSHFILNLPASSINFLYIFNDFIKNKNINNYNAMIHLYSFDSNEDGKNILEYIENTLSIKMILNENCFIHYVRNVAPKKHMLCFSFFIEIVNKFKKIKNI